MREQGPRGSRAGGGKGSSRKQGGWLRESTVAAEDGGGWAEAQAWRRGQQ